MPGCFQEDYARFFAAAFFFGAAFFTTFFAAFFFAGIGMICFLVYRVATTPIFFPTQEKIYYRFSITKRFFIFFHFCG
jgi:hypothetical protein